MMSLSRIFGLTLLFLFFEAVVAVATKVLAPDKSVILTCAEMTGLAICTWLVFALIAKLLSRAAAPKTATAPKTVIPAKANVPAGTDSFTLEFTALVKEANRRLLALQIEGQREAPTVASLPLYLVMGPEGSGKTAVVVNSGLEPRLLAGETQKDGDVVPTAVANLWFAEGALFVEISGRVLMQDSDRWEKALQILGQQRKSSRWETLLHGSRVCVNLRGVILVCDTDLLIRSKDVHRLATTARTLNDRLQSVQSSLRSDVPVYVLITKCDAVPYFREFFAHLSDVESRRILGVTLPFSEALKRSKDEIYAEQAASRFAKLLNRLYQSIADKRIIFLSREDSVDKRALAFEFPREFKKLRGDLVQFLLDVFRPSSLRAPCRVRGFYFAGRRLVPRSKAAVDVVPLDQSMVKKQAEATVFFSSSERTSTLDYSMIARPGQEASIAKWTFLAGVFRDIILADPIGKFIAAPQRAGESKYLSAAFGSLGAIFLFLSVIWVFSWDRNHTLLNNVEAAISATHTVTDKDVAQALPQLESLRPILVRLHGWERTGPPLEYRWGLYTGASAARSVDRLYFAVFRQVILHPTLTTMTAHFRELQPNAPVSEDISKEVRVYRTVTSGACNANEVDVAAVLREEWTGGASGDVETAALAEQQILFYASELKVANPYGTELSEDAGAVHNAQSYLRGLGGPDKILQNLLYQVGQQQQPVRLSGYAGNSSAVLTGPDQVDAPYTAAGWNQVEESIRDHKLGSTGESCVVGSENGIAQWAGDASMDAQVQTRYSDIYIQAWKQFLGAHHVIPFQNAPDAAQKLRTLADSNRSPLLALIYMTSANTNVAAAQSVPQQVSSAFENVTAGAESKVKNALRSMSGGVQPQPQLRATSTNSVPTVFGEFAPVRAMVDPGSPNSWLNEKNQPYINAVAELGTFIEALPPQVHGDQPMEMQTLQSAKDAVPKAYGELQKLAGNFPNTTSGIDIDLKSLLREPIDQAKRVVYSVRVLPATVKGTDVAPKPLPPDLGKEKKIRDTIAQVNSAAQSLCNSIAAVQHKYPFDATSSVDATTDDLNQILQPAVGAYARFSTLPVVSATYSHTGRAWSAKPEFPATASEQFLDTLSNLAAAQDALYGSGSLKPHFEFTVSLDGTGKIPFELDLDGHKMTFNPEKPKKTSPPEHFVWPPLTSTPTRISWKGTQIPQSGSWGFFRVLQIADDQTGTLFTYRNTSIGHGIVPLTNDKGVAGTIQIRIDSAGVDLFGRGYFARLGCTETWALQGQGPGN